MTNFYFYYNYCYGRLRRWVMDQSCMHHWFDEISHWTIFCIRFSFLFLFSFHFSSVFFFVKKISLTFCWQFSCVSNQDIDFLISITEYRLKVKTDIMNFEWGYVKFKIVEDKYELRILKRLFEIQNLRKSNVPH